MLDLFNFNFDNPLMLAIMLANSIIVGLAGFLYIFQNIHCVLSLFTKKIDYKETDKFAKFAVLICARNEGVVLHNLIDSINKQEYPKDNIKIFVCADNSTDNTASVAKELGAVVYERFDTSLVGKSYAMDYLLKSIKKEEDYDTFDAFLVFDADNLVTSNYFHEMNKTLQRGFLVATSYRESKNFYESKISALSGMMFYRECSIMHHSRAAIGLGTNVSGTGYYIAKSIIDNLDGWPFHTMIEDVEFSIYCATNGIKIGFNENALFYDEQPTTLKVSNTQRLRWCKGNHQCFKKYGLKLIKGMFTGKLKITCFEMFAHVSPTPIISFTWFIMYLIINYIYYKCGIETESYFINTALISTAGLIFSLVGIVAIYGFIAIIKNKYRKIPFIKKIGYSILFPFFFLIYLPLSFIALFKNVKWKHIPHTSNTNIDKVE